MFSGYKAVVNRINNGFYNSGYYTLSVFAEGGTIIIPRSFMIKKSHGSRNKLISQVEDSGLWIE